MLRSIRRKFVFYSVSVVALVVTVVCLTLNYVNYSNVDKKTSNVLDNLIKNHTTLYKNSQNGDENSEKDTTTSGVNGVVSSEAAIFNGFGIATVDQNNKVTSYYSDDKTLKDDESIRGLVNKVIEDNSTSDFIDNYRYLKIENSTKKIIVFANCERELESYYYFLHISILISAFVIGMVALLLIVISKRVIAPIEQSYKKQKQFITDASHELKTPLTIIRSNTDVLELEHGSSKWISNIQNQVDRLTSLVNNLVVFSRMEEKESVEKIKFSLSDLIEDRMEDFMELAQFQGKIIVPKIEKGISYIGEKQTIIQLLDILLDNAVKYAPKDTLVNISLKKNRRQAILKISNNANVEKGDLSKVFDRFYRLDESRNSNIKGYGIGLSLAKVIVEKHKEQIKAYSPEDGIFTIEIKFSLDS